jgi:hypothetical protein
MIQCKLISSYNQASIELEINKWLKDNKLSVLIVRIICNTTVDNELSYPRLFILYTIVYTTRPILIKEEKNNALKS